MRATAARLAPRLPHGSQHTLVELPQAIPGDRNLEGLVHQPEPGDAVEHLRTAQQLSPVKLAPVRSHRG
jgi:hypothetical protein